MEPCQRIYDEVSYGDYLEQITYLLFLKMADELNKPPYNKGLKFPRLKDVEGNEKKAGRRAAHSLIHKCSVGIVSQSSLWVQI